jgi:hypothetical protein
MTRNPRNSLRNAPVGTRYGSFTVLGYAGRNEHKQAMWLCRCDCGNERPRVAYAVLNGLVTRCINCSAREIGARRRVNAERDAAIIAARVRGIGPAAIAQDLGVKPNAVSGVIHRAKQNGLLPAERAEA